MADSREARERARMALSLVADPSRAFRERFASRNELANHGVYDLRPRRPMSTLRLPFTAASSHIQSREAHLEDHGDDPAIRTSIARRGARLSAVSLGRGTRSRVNLQTLASVGRSHGTATLGGSAHRSVCRSMPGGS